MVFPSPTVANVNLSFSLVDARRFYFIGYGLCHTMKPRLDDGTKREQQVVKTTRAISRE